MSPSWATFLFEAANFLLLAAVLAWLFFRPVRAALERRRGELEADQRAAAEARSRAERELEESRSRRRELEASLDQLRERIRREAEAEGRRLLAASRDQAQREREALADELEARRRSGLRSLLRDATAAAREIVVRLLEQVEGPEVERALQGTACRELEKLRSVGPLAPVVIETARELSAEERARVMEAAGVSLAEASLRVDPDLVAGLRVLTARGLVDVSAAGLADQVEGALAAGVDGEGADGGG